MGGSRFVRHVERIREELYVAFTEDHTAREISASFALGTFIAMLPTLGTGLALFAVIVYLFDWVSRLALFASVLVFNPLVKWGVYAASFALGAFLLGPVEGVSATDVSLGSGTDIAARLLVGNLLLAALATLVSYVVVYRLAVRYAATDVVETVDETLEDIAEDVLEP